MISTSWLEIDLGGLDANLAAFGAAAGESVRVCAVVKADAYGLGAVPIARRLGAAGVKLLAVYSLAEARELANVGLPCPILILAPVEQLDRTDILYRAAVNGRLHLTVHSDRQLKAVDRIGRQFGSPMPVHIELDSGMSRGGMAPDEAVATISRIVGQRYVKLVGLFTHPATAEGDAQATDRQMHVLDQVIDRLGEELSDEVIVHFANTYAALRDRRYHRHMLRIGLGLYGYGQAEMVGQDGAGVAPLRPIVRWVSTIVHTRRVGPDTPVGYGATFRTQRQTTLGIVPAGYADGYPLALTGRAAVRVGPARHIAPIRGAVNMDQLVIDLTEAPDAGLGTEVEIYASDTRAVNALPALAEAAQTNCYELLCRLSPRLTRRYITG
jgi:alanine racemase